jgi:catechol 2,3-dioxygenase-like lactoylglutathione lyase family enzyme
VTGYPPSPAALAGFYRQDFGLDEIGRSADGDITLSDGGFNVTLFRLRSSLREPRMELGLHHLGIAVDDVEAVVTRYRARYPRGTVIAENRDLQHGEVRIYDPECNPVTLSGNNFGLGDAPARVPRIAHLALNALDTEAILDFYRDVFGFRELFEAHKESRKRPGYRNKHVGDGHSNVAIQAFYSGEEGTRRASASRIWRPGAGFSVAERVQANGATVKARPAHRTQSEMLRDPEGNGCDLSQRGWGRHRQVGAAREAKPRTTVSQARRSAAKARRSGTT